MTTLAQGFDSFQIVTNLKAKQATIRQMTKWKIFTNENLLCLPSITFKVAMIAVGEFDTSLVF